MIAVDGVKKSTIRSHYQLGTVFYRLLWGPHIHHGLWTADESAAVAQCQLTDTLAEMGEIGSGDKVLDVGCGMGGSSIRLALKRKGEVTGITLSPIQRHWAAASAAVRGARSRTRFLAADAETVEFDPESFDVIWSVECTEHLFDKPEFFRRATQWLRPGGRLAFSVWCGPEVDTALGYVFGAIEKFGHPDIALPPGPGANDYADPDRVFPVLEAAGFGECRLATIASMWRVDDPGAPYDFFREGTARGGALLRPQPEENAAEIRAAVVAQVLKKHGDGPEWDVPIPAVVMSAIAV